MRRTTQARLRLAHFRGYTKENTVVAETTATQEVTKTIEISTEVQINGKTTVRTAEITTASFDLNEINNIADVTSELEETDSNEQEEKN